MENKETTFPQEKKDELKHKSNKWSVYVVCSQ